MESERVHRGDGVLVEREPVVSVDAAQTTRLESPRDVPPLPPPPEIKLRAPTSWLLRRR